MSVPEGVASQQIRLILSSCPRLVKFKMHHSPGGPEDVDRAGLRMWIGRTSRQWTLSIGPYLRHSQPVAMRVDPESILWQDIADPTTWHHCGCTGGVPRSEG